MEVQQNNVPTIKLSSKSIHPFVRIGGPHYSFPDTFIAPYGTELFSSKSISTFPHNPNQIPPREGDPISDRYFCAFYENKALLAISSGYGKGFSAVDAAEKAIIGFVEHMTSVQSEILSTSEAAKALEKACIAAQEKIVEDKDDISKVGTCSFIGGLLLELNVTEEFAWAFVCCSVGNCKAFRLSADPSTPVVDITQNSYLFRPSSPNSFFGANAGDVKPTVYFCPCQKSDVILLATEGAHSNFHPQQMGKTPQECNVDSNNNDNNIIIVQKEDELLEMWKNISPEDQKLLNSYICRTLQDCIFPVNNFEILAKPSEIVDRIINYNLRISKEVREKMVSEDLKYEQLDKSKYHTFIGHTTAIAIKAVPLVASCTPSADGLIDKVNSVWQWKAFLPINDSNEKNFDIWEYLINENSQLEATIAREEELDFSECYINVKSDDVLFYQVLNRKEDLTIDISVRTKANNITRVERWESAGKFVINDKTTKRYLSSTISNLLRQKEFDRRKIKDIIVNFLSINTLKDTIEITGKRKIVQFPQFGESMKTLSGDVTFSQSKLKVISDEETPKQYQVLELFSTSEKRLVQFIQKLRMKLSQDWIICSFPELLNDIFNTH